MAADGTVRHDWTIDQITALHELPLLELVGRANAVHRQHHDPNKVQKASLLSIKTGGCPENCAYCPQSAHHRTVDLTRDRLMDPRRVIEMAATAANSVFYGDTLLTTPNADLGDDVKLFGAIAAPKRTEAAVPAT